MTGADCPLAPLPPELVVAVALAISASVGMSHPTKEGVVATGAGDFWRGWWLLGEGGERVDDGGGRRDEKGVDERLEGVGGREEEIVGYLPPRLLFLQPSTTLPLPQNPPP